MITYTFTIPKGNIANGEVNFNEKQGFFAQLYWGDDNGIFEDFLPMAEIENSSSYTISDSRCIPDGATALYIAYSSEKGVTGTVEDKIDLPEAKITSASAYNYSFHVMSDFHGEGNYWNNYKNRMSALNDANSCGASHIVFSGDVGDLGQSAQYEKIKDYIDDTNPCIPTFFAAGNHDYHSYIPEFPPQHSGLVAFFKWQYERNMRLGCDMRDSIDTYFDGYFKGVHYIILNSSNEECRFKFGEEQLEWLEAKLCESDNLKMPAIVVNHFPISNTIGFHRDLGRRYFSDEDKLKEILSKHRFIYISGHTHCDINSEYAHGVLVDGKNAYVEASCAVWTHIYTETKSLYDPYRCLGYSVEVYDDRIRFRGREFTSHKYLGKCDFTLFL